MLQPYYHITQTSKHSLSVKTHSLYTIGVLQKSSFISLPKIMAVEKVEEKSFGSANVMQIISCDAGGQMETLYLDCKVRRTSTNQETRKSILLCTLL